MTLRYDQDEWLIMLTHHFDQDPDVLSRGFETDFLTDVGARWREQKYELFVSGKMMNILRRLGENRYGMNWQEYEE